MGKDSPETELSCAMDMMTMMLKDHMVAIFGDKLYTDPETNVLARIKELDNQKGLHHAT